MLQIIQLELHILGNSPPKSSKTAEDESTDAEEKAEDDNMKIIYHGILKRSNRVPSLLEFDLFINLISPEFPTEYEIITQYKNPLVVLIMKKKRKKNQVRCLKSSTNYSDM